TDGLRVYDGAAALVRSLAPGAWAVATSGTALTAQTRLDFADLPTPAVLVTAEDVSRGKPDPEAYLLAASRLGVDPARCVVVEDAPAGVEAARRAGMRPIAVTTTHAAAQLGGAVAVVSSVGSLVVAAGPGGLRVEAPAVGAV
ncbi:HAD-IA family hydrolase, partial [Rubrivirga sp.]|uniref:HAD-IA family hydrolase n=1 Tax=Rubrivirga sp. TaxID=1885344 RepID=UPI003C765ABD